MSAIAVDTTAVNLGGVEAGLFVLQNLGPDALYIGNDATVSDTTGVKLLSGGDFTNADPHSGNFWVVSEGTSDVRLLVLGDGQ
jgi:hypothetical protein